MRVAVLSNTRVPTLPDGPYGLGRTAHAIASGLAARGHDVTLFAGPGSQFVHGELVVDADERKREIPATFDVYLDTSHHHAFGLSTNLPVVNRIGDRELRGQPPNAVVETPYMAGQYPGATVAPKGVDVDAIPFYPEHGEQLRYTGQLIRWKGFYRAKDVAKLAGRDLTSAGPNLTGRGDQGIDNWRGVLSGPDLWDHIGGALCHLAPSQGDASPRFPLEAAATGAPVLCLSGDGTEHHVEHCVTGFVCGDLQDMAHAIDDVRLLDRRKAREWVGDTHSMRHMIDAYERLLYQAGGA